HLGDPCERSRGDDERREHASDREEEPADHGADGCTSPLWPQVPCRKCRLPWKRKAWSSASGTFGRSTTSTCGSAPARSAACSGRTAPARRRCCGCCSG